MKIVSPPNLHYPITVVELQCKRDDDVVRSTPLFGYYYETLVSEKEDRYSEPKMIKKRFPAQFKSSTEGVISAWFVKPGTVISRSG